MKLCLRLLLIILFIVGCKAENYSDQPLGQHNLAYKWGQVSLVATANNTEMFRPRPTVTSRILALIWTAVFDAWSRYDSIANPVYLKTVEKRPEKERSLKNKETAISYAAYRTMMEYYSHDSIMLTKKMSAFGFDPADVSLDPSTAVGIGNLAARSVI